MAQIKNNFLKGSINKDLDDRLIPNGQLRDAINFMVTSEDGSNLGVGKNLLGNLKVTNFNFPDSETIGAVANEGKELVYYFVTSPTFDYIIEYNAITQDSEIILQSSSNGVLNFNKEYRVTHADIFVTVEGSDFLSWTDGFNPPRIVSIDLARTYGVDGFTDTEISVMKPAPSASPNISPSFVGEDNADFIIERFVSFAYRWKYNDGFYSALSPFSEYVFTNGDFVIDFDTSENTGMVSIFNAANISFNTGGRDVIGIDLVFKESGSNALYLIERLDKEYEGYGNSQIATFLFSNSKIYSLLPESQYFRNFDNVPLTAMTQARIGNRLVYGNFVEGRDMLDINGDKVNVDLKLSYDSSSISKNSVQVLTAPFLYDYGSGVETVDDASIYFNLDDFDLREGSLITIKFNLDSNGISIPREPENPSFRENFNYLIESDYESVEDFINNSNFVQQIEEQFTLLFDNEAVFPPLGTTQTDLIGFSVSLGYPFTGDNNIRISIPYIAFNVDGDIVTESFNVGFSSVMFSVNGRQTSMHSNREYEVCIVYLDEQGRETTAFTSKNNTTFIPISQSTTKNVLNVEVNHNPPSWAKRYRFGVKEFDSVYDTVYATTFFEDGVYRWIKLDGTNKDKVKEGDNLIVKRDKSGVKNRPISVRVLEIASKEKDFLDGNVDVNGVEIIEPSGLYMKIKPINVSLNYGLNEFSESSDDARVFTDRPITYVDLFTEIVDGVPLDRPISAGDQITIVLDSHRSGRPDAYFEQLYTAGDNYANLQDWFDEEINVQDLVSNTGQVYDEVEVVRGFVVPLIVGTVKVFNFTPDPNGKLFLKVKGIWGGNDSNRRGFVKATVRLRSIEGLLIFETEPTKVLNRPFFKTPETYAIINNQHQFTNHRLTRCFNCYVFGNGAESNTIKDLFNAQKVLLDIKPTTVIEDEYRQINRYADLTWSGILQESTNVNRLNEFNLSLSNFKDDLEKSMGSIIRLDSTDTDLKVIQEDRWTKVFYGKDLLFNADGTSNLSRIEDVLGQQIVYNGAEFGISTHAESYADYGSNSFCTDVNNGVVVRFNDSNGLAEISMFGMRDYFKRLFRDNTIKNVIAEYDSFYDIYILNIKFNENEYVTWYYSPEVNGWLTRATFNPDKMIRVNNELLSFLGGDVYRHNVNENRNFFYGQFSPSIFSFNFNEQPSIRKNFRAISVEGTTVGETELNTDLQRGFIGSNMYLDKEGVFYSYVRGDDSGAIDSATLSVQGIGEVLSAVFSGVNLDDSTQTIQITFNSEVPSSVSIGDLLYRQPQVLMGVIQNISGNTITVVQGFPLQSLSPGSFVYSVKRQEVETSGLLGYFMNVEMTLNNTNQVEIYAVNAEIHKSFQ